VAIKPHTSRKLLAEAREQRLILRPAQEILHVLADRGLLLTQDKKLPNVVTLLTGQSLRNSWWSHPKARLIFAVLSDLAQRPDVLFTKLLYGKVTLLHRRLWSPFLAVASAREPWQVRGLSPKARRLLRTLEAEGSVQASGAGARELEVRLLAHAEEVHTESGRHEIHLEAWHAWSQRVGEKPAPSVSQARRTLETAVRELGAPLTGLPWRPS
jgi:hypothetical protein